MGSFANTIFSVLLGWAKSLIQTIWNAFTTDSEGSFFTWIAKHWLILAAVLCLGGVVFDFLIYVIRWQPFRVWKSFFHGRKKELREEEPDFRDEPEYRNEPEEVPIAVMTTPAGYRVPQDSPYRRPAEEDVPDLYPETEEIEQRIVRSGRRRRTSRLMNDDTGKIWPETYSDDLIDKKEAYYRPVYPQGWKQQEDDGSDE